MKATEQIIVRSVDAFRSAMGHRFPPLGPHAFRMLFRMLPDEATVEIVRGIRIRANFKDLTFRSTYWQGSRFEGHATKKLSPWFQSNAQPVFFDIGSNYGFFSYWVYATYPAATIHAFEPNPVTFARLNETVRANNLTRLHPHAMGLSDENTTLLLSSGTEDLGHSTFGNHPGLQETSKSEVPVETFDTWLSTHPMPTQNNWIAKIDVEGFELRVLKGMAKAFSEKRFAGLMIEINPFTLAFNNTSPDQVYELLNEYGYMPLFPDSVTGHFGNQFFVPRQP